MDAVGGDLHHPRIRPHDDAELSEEPLRRGREPLRQCRNDAVGRLDERDLDVFLGIDLVEPEGDDAAHGAVKLRRQLGAGRAGADDRDMELPRPHRLCLSVRPQAGVDEPAVEALRLIGGVEAYRMLLDAGRAEIVGDAADCDDQRVVGNFANRRDRAAFLVEFGVELDHFARPVEADHLAVAKPEPVPVSLGEIIELVPGHIHAASGDLVEQRLPQMRTGLVDERDLGPVMLPELIAEAGDEL